MDVDDLYALPLDRFVPERGTLAKALRADGRRDEAKDVAALRKPSVAAWAINQLVRTQGDAVDELVAAGDALRGAHADMVGGRGDVQALRTATERERGAVDTLLDAVRRLLCPDGPALSDAVVERVADTLHSAAPCAPLRSAATRPSRHCATPTPSSTSRARRLTTPPASTAGRGTSSTALGRRWGDRIARGT